MSIFENNPNKKSIQKLDPNKAKMEDLDPTYQEIAAEIAQKVPQDQIRNVASWLVKMSEAGERIVTFHEAFDTFPYDGAMSFYLAMKEKFGFVEHKEVMSFFGPMAPPMISVPTSYGEVVQVPWGTFAIPGYDGFTVSIGTHPTKDGFHFCIGGEVKTKDRDVVTQLARLIRKNLAERSIYRGKAVSFTFAEDFDPEDYQPDDVAPEFLDLSSINPDELILPAKVERMIQDSLFTPVEKTAACRKYGIRLRRGVLLAGTYGVGKTMTANILAQKSTQNGWTFIYLKNVRDLPHGIRMAKQYAPAVVFAEDIDSVMGGDERTDEKNEILNTIDGIEIKGKEVIVVLTTNHVEKINRAMVRPGRIDALIEMTAPDAKAAEKLLRVYGKGYILPEEDLTVVGKLLDGQRPAMIAEVIERSKLSAVTRLNENEPLNLKSEDLEAAAHSLRHHIELIDRPMVKDLPANGVQITPQNGVQNGMGHLSQSVRNETRS